MAKIKNDGIDYRFNKTSDLDIELLNKIKNNLKKIELLHKLQDNSIGIHEKIKIIEREKILSKSDNILNGLGKNDFYYDF